VQCGRQSKGFNHSPSIVRDLTEVKVGKEKLVFLEYLKIKKVTEHEKERKKGILGKGNGTTAGP